MVGTINLALTQQLDEYAQPLAGGQLYFIQAGTVSTPQNAFVDNALTVPWPNPIVLDSAGRIPMFYLADGQIKVRLQDKNGVVKFTQDNLLVIGPSTGGGGGGGASVDPTTILATGDIKARYGNAIITGFVRLNGKTIGSATSGATELADPSAQSLFQYLWNTDTTLTVSGGRGVSAAADWGANKTILLPDARARNLMGLADMGNTDVGLLAGCTFLKGTTTILGSMLGLARQTLSVAMLPAHQHNVYLHDPGHIHTVSGGVKASPTSLIYNFYGPGNQGSANVNITINSAVTGLTVGSVPGVANDNLTTNTGGGTAFDVVSPALLVTIYMKI